MKFLLNFFFPIFITSCVFLGFDNRKASTFSVSDLQDVIQIGMKYEKVCFALNAVPISLGNDTFKFLMKDGELFTRFSSCSQAPDKLLLWKSFLVTPEGKRLTGPDSKKQTLEIMKNNPICINVKIVSTLNGEESTGECYYEQFSPDDIVINAGNNADKIQMIFFDRRFVFAKGDVPEKQMLKYLTGYIANLNLLQSILGRAMGVSVKNPDGKRTFSMGSKEDPLVVLSLNKKAVYSPPWTVNGFFIPVENQKAYDFSFTLSLNLKNAFNGKNLMQKTTYKGFFIQKTKSFDMDLNLDDWMQYSLVFENNNLSIIPLPIKISTLNQLE